MYLGIDPSLLRKLRIRHEALEILDHIELGPRVLMCLSAENKASLLGRRAYIKFLAVQAGLS